MRLPRFRLRILMIAVLVVGSWMGWQVNKARNQRAVASAVREYGGWVRYDWEFVNGKLVEGREPQTPSWLRKRLGDEYFQEIAYVSLGFDGVNPRPPEPVLARLASQNGIKTLALRGLQATDLGLRNLRRVKSLEELAITSESRVSDAGIAHLANLTNLRRFRIYNINASRVTDASLELLGALPNLEELTLRGHHISDAGLASLKGLSRLKRLDVGFSKGPITDKGLVHLKGMKSLELLDVRFSRVTAEGLEQLRGLPKLRELSLYGTGMTKGEEARLRASFPSVKFLW